MAHKNLIGGTAYDTKGGNCLVDGTGYSIKKGRTLVGGTGYDVVFSSPVAVSITSSPNPQRYATYAYAIIGGTTYYTEGTTEVEPGDTITFYVSTDKKTASSAQGKVVIDDTGYSTDGKASTTIEWTVPFGISKIAINVTYYPYTTGYYYGLITVKTS